MDNEQSLHFTISGTKVALGPLQPTYMTNLLAWFNDLDVMHTWGLRRAPATLNDV